MPIDFRSIQSDLEQFASGKSAAQSGGDLVEFARTQAQELGVPVEIAERLIRLESGGRADAVSPKGAFGPAQLMPKTAKELASKYGGDPSNPYDNIRLGMHYLRDNYDQFGDWRLAAAAYQAGPGSVKRAGGIPNTTDGITSTPDYVRKVVGPGLGVGAMMPTPRVPGSAPARDAMPGAVEPPMPTGDYSEFQPLPQMEGWQGSTISGLDDVVRQQAENNERARIENMDFGDKLTMGFKKGAVQSLGLLGGLGAAAGDALDIESLQKAGMDLYTRQMEKAQEYSVAPSFTDVVDGKAELSDWLAENIGYGVYQVTEALATGGAGALLLKGAMKPAAAGMMKGFVEREVGKTLAAPIEAEARKLIAGGMAVEAARSAAEKTVVAKVGEQAIKAATDKAAKIAAATLATTANNFRQELGSIYGEAAENNTVDWQKILPAAAGATALDTLAEVYFGAKVLGTGAGRSGGYAARLAKELPAQMAVQGGTEGGQSAIEQWGAGKESIDLKQVADEAAVGGLMGGLGAPVSAMQKKEQPAAPSGVLGRAAQAGQAATPAGSPTPVDPNAPNGGAMVPAGKPTPIEGVDARISALMSRIDGDDLLNNLRQAENFGPESATELLRALAIARNGNIDPMQRRAAIDGAERLVSAFDSRPERPNFTMPPSAPEAGLPAVTMPGGAVAATPEPGVTVDGEFSRYGGELSDPNVPATRRLPPAAVRALPDPEKQRVLREAEAEYDQAFADLLKVDQLASSEQQLRDAALARQYAEARLAEIQEAIAGSRAAYSAQVRRSLLDEILADPQTANPLERFEAEMRRQGYAEPAARPEEVARVQRFIDIRDAKPAAPEVEPSTPNEMDPGSLGVRERRAQRPDTPRTAAPAAPLQPMESVREQGIDRPGSAVLDNAGAGIQVGDEGAGVAVQEVAGIDGGRAAEGAAYGPGAGDAEGGGRQDRTVVDAGVPDAALTNSVRAESTDNATDKTSETTAAQQSSTDIGDSVGAESTEVDDAKRVELDVAADVTNTAPTEAQKQAGNYQKGRVSVQGFPLAIESPKGSVRRGVDKDGTEWTVTMPADYGYIERTEGADGDQVDAFIGDRPETGLNFVVNQNRADSTRFDEHKVMLGFSSEDAAIDTYFDSFSNGFGQRLFHSIDGPYTAEELRALLPKLKKAKPVQEKAPAGEVVPAEAAGDRADLRPELEALIRMKAGARQIGKEDALQAVIDRAKAYMQGGAVEPGVFVVRAKQFKDLPVVQQTIDSIVEKIRASRAPAAEATPAAPAQPEPAAAAPAETAEPAPLPNATAPEHVQTGVDDRELSQIVSEFNSAQKSMIEDGERVTHVFDPPAKKEVVRLNDKVKVFTKENGWMTPEQARARIAEWKAHAQAQGDDPQIRSANSQKVVLSLFDLSGEWSKPWEEAGYQVFRFDIQDDPTVGDVNNFSTDFFQDWFGDFEGMDIHAVLAACPCTDFAVSGARHFAAKDKDGRTVASVKLVHQTLRVIEYFKPAVWAVENPVGRIEELGGLPPWRLSFDPNHLGDPYTKKTLIWGRFNGDLPIAPVEPTEGSKMHRLYGGKSQATKNARSVTPEGFSYGFFMANNAHDHPAMALANKFDRLDRGLIEKAVDAGVQPEEIETAVEDFYFMEMDDEAANDAIRALIDAGGPRGGRVVEQGPSQQDAGQGPSLKEARDTLAWLRAQDRGQEGIVSDARLTERIKMFERLVAELEADQATDVSSPPPVPSIYGNGMPDPRNSPPMQELGGFKVGDRVKVNGRTIEDATIQVLFKRSLPGFDTPDDMARLNRGDGMTPLDVQLFSLEKISGDAPASDRSATGQPQQSNGPLRAELEQMSGEELRAIMDRMSLAGARMTHDERVETLLAEDEAEVRAAMVAPETAPAAAAEPEVRNPKTFDEFIGDVDAGYRAHFDYAGAHGTTVWIEQTEKGWVVKQKDDDSTTVFTKGAAGAGGGWGKVGALQAAKNLASYRFNEWKPVAAQSSQPVSDLQNADGKFDVPNPPTLDYRLVSSGGSTYMVPAVGDSFSKETRTALRDWARSAGFFSSIISDNKVAVSQITGGPSLDYIPDGVKEQAYERLAKKALNRASVEDNGATNPGEYLVRGDGHNLARFKLNDRGRPVGVKFFFDSSQTRDMAQEAIDAFVAEKNASGQSFGKQAVVSGNPEPSANTIFTEDAAAKAREVLRRKLGQLNTGLDPEILQAGITLAGYHIEKGARKFAAYARAMLDDMGDAVKPYLKSWYMGVKYDPRAAAFSDDMSSAAEVDAADVSALQDDKSTADGDMSSAVDEKQQQADAVADAIGKAIAASPVIVEHVTGKGKTIRGIVRTDLTHSQAKEVDPFTFRKDGGFFIREKYLDQLPPAVPGQSMNYDEGKTAERDGNEQNGNGGGNESALAPVSPGVVSGAREDGPAGSGGGSGSRSDVAGNGRAAEDVRDQRAGSMAGEPGAVLPEGSDEAVTEVVTISGEEKPLEEIAQSMRTDAPASEPKPKSVPRQGDNPGNYSITDEDAIGTGTTGERIRANMAAVRLVLQLERENRYPTREEQRVLAKYVGWGGLKNVFKGDNSTSKQEREAYAELKRILTPDQLFWMGQSVLDAHYTAPRVVRAMYRVLKHFGIEGGRFIEPTVGVGNFIGLQPAEMAAGSKWFASEIDPVTSLIARHLYPESQVLTATGFQNAEFAYGRFDVAIGNPPFGDQRITDTNKKRADISGFKIHNYIIAKSAMHLRPGGIMAFVVTSRFLDTSNPEAREYLARNFRFLGAFRLPNNAFKENAGTEVTTDIIFLQRMRDGETADVDSWLDTDGRLLNEDGETVRLNRYFAENPELMLGKPSMQGTMYGGRGDEFTLQARDGLDIDAEIDRLLSEGRLGPAGLARVTDADREVQAATVEINREDVPIGGYFRDGDRIIQRTDDDAEGNVQFRELTPETPWTEKQSLGETRLARIRGIMEMRDMAYDLMAAERGDMDVDQIEGKRRTLNERYDEFVKEHGFLNDKANRALFDDDPRIEFGLESNYRKGISAAVAKKMGTTPMPPAADKSSLLIERVFYPRKEVESADNPRDGYSISLSERGRLDLEYIADLTGMSVDAVIEDLSGGERPLIFRDPASNKWVQEDAYLSGNVKEKLKLARGAGLDVNVRALEAVQPADVAPEDIHVEFGATWVPAEVYVDFLRLFGVRDAQVAVMPLSGSVEVLSVTGNEASPFKADIENPDYTLAALFSAVANRRKLVAYDGTADTRVLNQERTDNLGRIRRKLLAIWSDWIKADPERSDKLAAVYNEVMNTTIERQFDGVTHLRTVGTNPAYSLRNSQKNSAWRMIQSSEVLLDHVVGAGKTMALTTGIMERKRLGLSKKPMVMVPNHLVGQWAREWLALYPGANILAATEKDFARSNRRRLFARIATGKFDAVIVGHTSFGYIPVSPEAEVEFIMREVEHLEQALTEAKMSDKKGKGESRQVRAIKNRIAKRTEKIKELQDKPRDNVATFEDMGIDYLAIDEFHEFKNLEYSTTLSNVAGMNSPEGSKKAFDLFMKIRLLQEAGGGIAAATGTPLSNSMVEMYTVLRYLNPGALERRNLQQFDAWVKAFASIEQRDEYTASGNLKARTVMASFNNLPELLQMYKQVADTVTMTDLKRIYADQMREENARLGTSKREEFPVPKVKDGGRRLDIGAPTPEQVEFMDYLIARANILDRLKGREKQEYATTDNALWLMNDARKMSLDVRIIDPTVPDNPNNKVNRAARKIKDIYDRTEADLGTQLVFCDLSTPTKSAEKAARDFIRDAIKKLGLEKNAAVVNSLDGLNYVDKWKALEVRADLMLEGGTLSDDERERVEKFMESVGDDERSALVVADSGFSVYDDLKNKLIASGIPENEIVFIHDANTSEQKRDLFELVNAGKVRVLIGSSMKMGAGTNAQRRLVALHHMDAPWRPSDMEQREGRIVRQGNMLYERDPDNFQVEIVAYSTERTFDAQMWGVLARKAGFLEQFRKGLRTIKEEASDADSYAEFMAEATGDQIFRDKIRLEREVEDLDAEDRSSKMKRQAAENTLSSGARRMAEYQADLEKAERYATADLSSVTFDGQTYRNDLAEVIDAADAEYNAQMEVFREQEEQYKVARKAWEDAAGTDRGRAPTKPVRPELPRLMSDRIRQSSEWARFIDAFTKKLELMPKDVAQHRFVLTTANGVELPVIAKWSGFREDGIEVRITEFGSRRTEQSRSDNMAGLFTPRQILSEAKDSPRQSRWQLQSLKQAIAQAEATLQRVKPVDPAVLEKARAELADVKARVEAISQAMAEERAQRSNRFIERDTKRFGVGGKTVSDMRAAAALVAIPASARFRQNSNVGAVLVQNYTDVAIDGLEEFTFFASKNEDGKWVVTENSTGFALGGTNHGTKKDAINEALATVARIGPDRARESIGKATKLSDDVKRAALKKAADLPPVVERRGAPRASAPGVDVQGQVTVADIDAAINRFRLAKEFRQIAFHPVETFADLPAALRAEVEQQYGQGSNPKGLMKERDGVAHVYLIAASHESAADVEATILHEVMGHVGVRRLFGADVTQALNRLYTSIGGVRGMMKIADARGFGDRMGEYAVAIEGAKASQDIKLQIMMEEVLSHIAEDPRFMDRVKALIGMIRQWLRDMGLANLSEMGETDLLAILNRAERALDRPGAAAGPAVQRGGVQASVSGTEPFYSALQRSIDAAPARSASADGWMQFIKSQISAGVVKADEVAWTGVEEWLGTQPGKVPREAVSEFLRDNGVRVEEVVLGAGEREELIASIQRAGFDVGENNYGDPILLRILRNGGTAEVMPDDDVPASVQEMFDQLDEARTGGGTKYSSYTLSGGANYREVLLTLPTGGPSMLEAMNDAELRALIMRNDEDAEVDGLSRSDLMQMIEGMELNTSSLSKLTGTEAAQYVSSHWLQPNVIAHVRMNDRTDDDGRRILFVEEIQSDWAQDGKKHGFTRKTMTADQRAAKLKEAKVLTAGIRRRSNADRDAGLEQITDETLELNKADSLRVSQIMRELEDDDATALSNTGRIPAAPFVDKTDKWVALALKRIIKMAVDGGYDRVAFVTGSQAASRFNLSQRVSSIRWSAQGVMGEREVNVTIGTGKVNFIVDADGIIRPASITGSGRVLDNSSIESLLGKGLAARIMGTSKGEVSGDGLNIGGAGMRAFYDQIVPSVLKSVLKKMGGGQLGDVPMRAGVDVTLDPDYGTPKFDPDKYEMDDDGQVLRQQPGFDVTPAMRAKAGGGLPLFSVGAARGRRTDTPASIRRALVKRFGESGIAALESGGILRIVPTWDALPQRIRDVGEPNGRAFYDAGEGAAYLIADRLSAGTAPGVLLHEIGEHYGLRRMLGERGYAGLVSKVRAMAKKPESIARAMWESVRNNYDEFRGRDDADLAADERFLSEVVARMGEEAVFQESSLWRDIKAALQRFLLKMGLPVSLDEFDVMALVEGSLKHAMRTTGGPAPRGGMEPAFAKAKAASDAPQASVASGLRDFMEATPTRRALSDKVADLFRTQKTFNWWNRTVGSQYHKAQKDPEFGRVFRLAQDYLDDVSRIASEAANKAGKLLPQLESVGEAFSGLRTMRQDAADAAALAGPVFHGTLMDKVWSDDELINPPIDPLSREPLFQPLTPAQIELYREFRAAVDKSLDDLAVSEMARLAKASKMEVAPLGLTLAQTAQFYYEQFGGRLETLEIERAELVRTHTGERKLLEAAATDLPEGSAGRRAYLEQVDEMRARQRAELKKLDQELAGLEVLRTGFLDKAAKISQLKAKGYAPLMRFGQYTVDVFLQKTDAAGNPLFDDKGEPEVVRDNDGEPVRPFFGMFESEREANEAARMLQEEYPDYTIRQGVLSQNAYELFKGVTPETVELFGQMIGAENEVAFQSYLKLAVSNRSAMKRLIQRKGMAGFAQDPSRVLAAFILSNARAAAGNWHFGDMLKAAAVIPKTKGDVKDEAVKLMSYVQNPQEEASAIRGILFAQHLGGSIASALVNMTQSFTTTYPYLHQFGEGSAAAVGEGMRMAAKLSVRKDANIADPALREALDRATEEGIVSPHEIHLLMGQANPTSAFGSNRLMRNVMRLWGSFYSLAERFNRHAAFIAGWKMAMQRGMAPEAAYQFAKQTVTETQFVYSKANKPNWARGAVGATLFTFKTFLVNYIEFLKRLPAKERALALAVLLAAAGLSGMPGADDLDDLIDTIGQALGFATNTKQAKQEFAARWLGKDAAGFLLHGVSYGLPLDLSSRLGVGNLIPGTAIFKKSEQDKSGEVMEAVGPAAGLAQSFARGFEAATSGEVMRGGAELLPKAFKDAFKAKEMYQTGLYKDFRGRAVTDVDAIDAMVKAIGFQPTDVAEVQRARVRMQDTVNLVKAVESDIAEKWARGLGENDREAVSTAREQLADWNRRNPDTPIKISYSQIQRRVNELRRTAADRLVKATPRELRAMVREGVTQ